MTKGGPGGPFPAPGYADSDHAALAAVAASGPGAGLATIVGIDGAFSRRCGAQLAVLPGGRVVGDLADGCLEQQIAADMAALTAPEVRRYGRGARTIDFRLPCGGGLDILLDPAPCRAACGAVMAALARRQPAGLFLPANPHTPRRDYLPALRVHAYGTGPELSALAAVGGAAGLSVSVCETAGLVAIADAGLPPPDRWTAIVLLFHEHMFELPLLEAALASEAFYIGAQGGESARRGRIAALLERGVTPESAARVISPVGAIASSRTPQHLALSILADVAGRYEKLRDG